MKIWEPGAYNKSSENTQCPFHIVVADEWISDCDMFYGHENKTPF